MKRVLLGIVTVGVLSAAAFVVWKYVLPMTSGTGVPVAFARDVWGDVEAGARALEPIDAGATLSGGERLRTRDASRAVLMLRGAGRLIVAADSELEFRNPQTDEDGRVTAIHVRLERGSIRVEAAADAVSELAIEIGDRVVGVEPGGKLLVQIGPEPDQVLVSFLDAAGFLVSPGGERRTLPANTGVRVTRKSTDAPSPEPEPVVLAAPPELPPGLDDARRIFTGDAAAAIAKFQFEKVDARIRMIVARDPELTDIVVDQLGSGTLEVPPLSAGSYYWAVATVDDDGLTGPFSSARELEIVAGEPPKQADEHPTTGVAMRPGESGSVFYTVDVPPVGIDWPGPTDSRKYRFRVSRDPKHTKPVIDTRTEESRYTARGLKPGRYHWKATAPDGKSSGGSFLVRKVTGAVPKKVAKVNYVSETFSSVRIVFQREAPTIEFSWKADARATGGYRLLVSRDPKLANPVVVRRTRTAKARAPSGAVNEGTYYWRVERLLDDGSVFYPGRVSTLRVQFDNDVPTLELTSPAQGQLISTTHVAVEGLAPRGLKLWVNGQRVKLDEQGRFSTQAKVNPARPRIIVRTLRGRRAAYYVRTLRYAPASSSLEE